MIEGAGHEFGYVLRSGLRLSRESKCGSSSNGVYATAASMKCTFETIAPLISRCIGTDSYVYASPFGATVNTERV